MTTKQKITKLRRELKAAQAARCYHEASAIQTEIDALTKTFSHAEMRKEVREYLASGAWAQTSNTCERGLHCVILARGPRRIIFAAPYMSVDNDVFDLIPLRQRRYRLARFTVPQLYRRTTK